MTIHVSIQRADARWHQGRSAIVRKAALAMLKSELSFPRRRESQAKDTKQANVAEALDSRLRGNDVMQRGNDNYTLTILLTNDAQVQSLNNQYRGKNKPTNVLSFPDGAVDETGAVYLGDIALAYETIEREAAAQGKSFQAHLTHLVMHGVLHLLGYDHERAADAKRMESREIALLATFGIANPYECD